MIAVFGGIGGQAAFPELLAVFEPKAGDSLTILFEDTKQETTHKPVSLLPLLTILFMLSYGMMAYLIVQQGRTIDNQRTLIHQFLSDSVELSAMKVNAHKAQVQGEAEKQSAAAPAQPQTMKPKASVTQKARPEKNKRVLPEKPSRNTGVVLDTRRVTFTL